MFKIIFLLIGTLIGAGFASGREIYLFFMQYGLLGVIGILLSGFLFSLVIYRVLIFTKVFEINNYNKLLQMINWKKEKINFFLNIIVNFFLLISFYIMVAGFSSFIKQTYGINIYLSSIFFVIICYLIFKTNIDGIVKVNKLLVPFLILLIVVIGINNIPFIIDNTNNISIIKSNGNWFLSSVLYVSYNSIVLVPVLTSIRDLVKDRSKRNIINISIISGLTIIGLALIIYFVLLNDTYFISQLDMPLLEVVKKLGVIYKYLYGFIIIASIFTSAISTGYSFLKNITNKTKEYNLILLIMCITSVFISNIGFSKLVEVLYPFFGFLGLAQIVLLFYRKL